MRTAGTVFIVALALWTDLDLPEFTTHPSIQSAFAEETVQFTAIASRATSYQWQETRDRLTFTNLQESFRFSGVTTTTLTIRDVATDLHGSYYRAIATNPDGSIQSQHAALIVNRMPITRMYSFTGGSDGGLPVAQLLEGTDGNLYGLTSEVFTYGPIRVFRLTHAGVLTTLTSYDGGNFGSYSGMVQVSDGSFCWTSPWAGNGGAVFCMTAAGALRTVHQFSGDRFRGDPGGTIPFGGIVEGVDGRLYGTTKTGGSCTQLNIGCGTIYSVERSGADFQVHYNFPGPLEGCIEPDECMSDVRGYWPSTTLIQTGDGAFLGTTDYGGPGVSNNRYQAGTVFEMSPSRSVRYLHWFDDVGETDNRGRPYTTLLETPMGDFFGMTDSGQPCDTAGAKVIFLLFRSDNAITRKCHPGGTGHNRPAPMILASNGTFYGTASHYPDSSIFSMNGQGVVTILFTFPGMPFGGTAAGGLTEGSDGKLYGVAKYGGQHGYGFVYSIQPPDLALTGPQVARQPARLSILNPGQTAHLHVSGTGTPALRYQWYRGTAGDVSQPLAGKTTRFLEATAGSSAARYWARITNAHGSVNSATATVTVPFADDPLVVRSSVIRASHITELRGRIDAVRLRIGLSAYPFAQAVIAGTLVRSSHIAELRDALQQVYSSLGLTAPVYTTGANAGDSVRATDLRELRAAVHQVE